MSLGISWHLPTPTTMYIDTVRTFMHNSTPYAIDPPLGVDITLVPQDIINYVMYSKAAMGDNSMIQHILSTHKSHNPIHSPKGVGGVIGSNAQTHISAAQNRRELMKVPLPSTRPMTHSLQKTIPNVIMPTSKPIQLRSPQRVTGQQIATVTKPSIAAKLFPGKMTAKGYNAAADEASGNMPIGSSIKVPVNKDFPGMPAGWHPYVIQV